MPWPSQGVHHQQCNGQILNPLVVEGGGDGGTNPCDVGLDLSGSWQQGHSATYNAPSRI